MDIKCPKCGEPVDADELHDVVGKTYREALAAFRESGCAGIGFTCGGGTADPLVEAVWDLLGDDPDGMAAMLEDIDGGA